MPARGYLHCYFISSGPHSKESHNHKPVKARLSPNFIASCDTVKDMDAPLFPNVFILALDRDQRNVKMSSGALPVSTRDNGLVIHEAGQSSKAKLDHMIKRLFFPVLESNKDLLKSQSRPNHS